jgi:hypothetical protein
MAGFAQKASISGYYRQGRLLLTCAEHRSEADRLWYDNLSSARNTTGNYQFVGVLIGNHCFEDGTCGLLACPAILIKKPISVSIDDLCKDLPSSACSR